jgi:hypothetical protein
MAGEVSPASFRRSLLPVKYHHGIIRTDLWPVKFHQPPSDGVYCPVKYHHGIVRADLWPVKFHQPPSSAPEQAYIITLSVCPEGLQETQAPQK